MGETAPRQPGARTVEWFQAHLNGASFAEIARTEGVHRSRVHQIVSCHPDYQGPGHRPPRDPAFIASVQCLRAQGLSMSQIGDRLGVSKNVIVAVCTRHLKSATLVSSTEGTT